MMVRDHDGFTGYFFESRPYSRVKRRAALEADVIPDFSSPDNAVEVVGDNGVSKARDEVFSNRSLLLITQQI